MTKSTPTWTEQCRTAFNEERFEDVAALANQALQNPVDDPELYKLIGNAFYELNRPKESVRFYEKSLEIDPLFWRANANLCNVYKNYLVDYERAKYFILRAYKTAGKHPLVMLHLADMHRILRDYKKASLVLASIDLSEIQQVDLKADYESLKIRSELGIDFNNRFCSYVDSIRGDSEIDLVEKKRLYDLLSECIDCVKENKYSKGLFILYELLKYSPEDYCLHFEIAKMNLFTEQISEAYNQLKKMTSLESAIDKLGRNSTFQKIKEKFAADTKVSMYLLFDAPTYDFEAMTLSDDEKDFINILFNHALVYTESLMNDSELIQESSMFVFVELALALHWRFNKKDEGIQYIKNFIAKAVTSEEKFMYTYYLAKWYIKSHPNEAFKLLDEAHNYIGYVDTHSDKDINEAIVFLNMDKIMAGKALDEEGFIEKRMTQVFADFVTKYNYKASDFL